MKKHIIALSLLVVSLSAGSRLHAMDELYAMDEFDSNQIPQCQFLENQLGNVRIMRDQIERGLMSNGEREYELQGLEKFQEGRLKQYYQEGCIESLDKEFDGDQDLVDFFGERRWQSLRCKEIKEDRKSIEDKLCALDKRRDSNNELHNWNSFYWKKLVENKEKLEEESCELGCS